MAVEKQASGREPARVKVPDKPAKPSGPLQLSGAITNLTREELRISNGRRELAQWSVFKTGDCATLAAPMLKTPRVALSTDPAGLTNDGPADDRLSDGRVYVAEPTVGVSGDFEEIGTLNGIFKLVRPLKPYEELKKLWLENLESFGEMIEMSRTPRAVTESKWRNQQQYYLVSRATVCLGVLKYATREAELEHWLVPARPVPRLGQIVGYRALVPANLLLPGEG